MDALDKSLEQMIAETKTTEKKAKKARKANKGPQRGAVSS